ncbi:MAG: DNA (cytosine-5-)-methyltransferase, partial [Christensenellaceae bacterium]|nr:DNA (cytosine-5-)-methyltransferase [Christensenellaceae bacterium]
MPSKKTVKFIDLFSGMGGIRIGFEQAFNAAGYDTECVLTSEIKDSALKALKINFTKTEEFRGDIRVIRTDSIAEFDFLLGGFPCQAFSVAGKQRGFADTRGTLFFEIERILEAKRPFGFLLENVGGLVTHDRENTTDKIGRTMQTILCKLDAMGYAVNWRVLDSKDFGLAQTRQRVYIVGTRKDNISLDEFPVTSAVFGDIMEHGLPTERGLFSTKLFANYKPDELYGKSIKDKRGGPNNIHSWDLGLRGDIIESERLLLNKILTQRRKKIWSAIIGIDWMDGIPLTLDQIKTFYNVSGLKVLLDSLVQKGYLILEHPKQKVWTATSSNTNPTYERVQDTTKPMGYNIVTGKLSFQFSRILCPNAITPAMV